MAAVGERAVGMIKGRLSEALPEPMKAYKQGFTEQEWKNLDVAGKPLYFDHKYDIGKIGHITDKWVEGGWLGVDAVIYKDEERVKPYYNEIMNGKVHSLSAGFWSDPVSESQPIRFKKFVEASVTDHPLEPGARIFVRRNDNKGGADSNAPTHMITVPFTLMKEGEALPPPPKHEEQQPSEASKSVGHDQKTSASPAGQQQEQKSGATSTESPKPTQQQASTASADSTSVAQPSAQSSVATSTTPPSSTTQLLSNAPPSTMSAPSSSDASAGQPQQQAPAQQQQQAGQTTPGPKSTTTFTNNFSNQDGTAKKSSEEEQSATKEQMNVFKDLQKLLKEKSAKAEQKAKAEAEAKAKAEAEAAAAKAAVKPSEQQQQAKEEQKPQTPGQDDKKKQQQKDESKLQKKAPQASLKKEQQQQQQDIEMAENDGEDEDDAEESASDRMSKKQMEKTIMEMKKQLDAFTKREQEAEAARQAEIEAAYEQNFSTIMEADKDLKFMPAEIRDKATQQLRIIFHTPEYSEAQQVFANLVARAAEAPQQDKAPSEEEQKSAKKRVRADEKPVEKKAKTATKIKKEQIEEDEEDDDLAGAAGFKVPAGMTPDVLQRKMQTGLGKPSSITKIHAQGFGRSAPPVLVQRNDSSRSSSSSVSAQFGDANTARAFEFLTQRTAKFDPAAKKALDDRIAKAKKLREEGLL